MLWKIILCFKHKVREKEVLLPNDNCIQMRAKNLFFSTIVTVAVALAAAGCGSNAGNDARDTATTTAGSSEACVSDTDGTTYFEMPQQQNENTVPAAVEEPVETKPARKAVAERKETIYISSYAANGKVWGHVTMTGKTGRGTIHDEDENSYSITVTRHGGELYGVDQNGRQYVFKM